MNLAVKEIAAIHEAGHACAVLAMPIRQSIVEVRLFDKNGDWLGDTRVDYAKLRLPKQLIDDCDFGKSIAGPLIQLELKRESVSDDVRKPITDHGYLDGFWWIYKNAPQTQINWHSDITTWISMRHYSHPQLQRFYNIENALLKWVKDDETQKVVMATATLLQAQATLQSPALFAIDTGKMPALLRP